MEWKSQKGKNRRKKDYSQRREWSEVKSILQKGTISSEKADDTWLQVCQITITSTKRKKEKSDDKENWLNFQVMHEAAGAVKHEKANRKRLKVKNRLKSKSQVSDKWQSQTGEKNKQKMGNRKRIREKIGDDTLKVTSKENNE